MIKRRKPIPRFSKKRLAKLKASGEKLARARIRHTRRKKRKYSKPPNGLTFPGALDPRSRRYPDGREELRGKDKSKRRAEIFERAGGRCEEIIEIHHYLDPDAPNDPTYATYERCPNLATEWSHKPCIHIGVGNGHGRGFKCDSIHCGIASCKSCHQKLHGG